MMDLDDAYMNRIARLQYPGDLEAEAQGEAMGYEQAAQQALVGTLPQDTTNITAKQFGKAAMDIPAALLKGGVQGTIGLPGDLISLGKGIAAAIRPNAGEGRVDAFLRGMEGKTLFPTTEDVRDFLDRTLGPVVPESETDEARRKAAAVPEFIGELGGGGKTMIEGAKAAAKTAAAGARFAAPKVGEMLDGYMRRTGMTFDLMAYHGSPQRFEKFEASKIGTGAKAQAYGYGMYFAENPEIAQTYKIGLTNPALQLTQELENILPDVLKGKAPDWVDEISSGKTFDDLLAMLNKQWQKTLLRQNKNQIEALIKRQQAGGALYTVDIPDEMVSKMLDWDALISQQSQEVQQLAKQYGLTDPDHMGGDLIAALSSLVVKIRSRSSRWNDGNLTSTS